jgi:hypothetical protein
MVPFSLWPAADLERFSLKLNRKPLYFFCFIAFSGEPVPTSPENALGVLRKNRKPRCLQGRRSPLTTW